MKFWVLFLCCLLAGPWVEGADKKKKSNRKKEQAKVVTADSTKSATKAIPAIKDFIKATSKKHTGMFNVYEQDDRYFVEVPDGLLGKDILVFISLVQGSAQEMRTANDFLGYGGDALISKVVRFEKGPKNKLLLHEPIFTTVMPDSLSDMYGTVKASNMMPIAVGFDVKAMGKNSVLVDFTELYTTDHPYFSLRGAKDMMNIGSYQADKSYPTTISAFAENVIFRSVKSYSEGKAAAAAPGRPKVVVNPTIWEVASSWYLLPEKPMTQRAWDSRVGYFAYGKMDYTKNPTKAEDFYGIKRWRLEPKPEDMEKFKRGELVEPAKPIVFYVDRNTPTYLQPYIITGIEAWQASFEKIGFKNAIIGKLAPTPEEDPNFSMEDARYSIVSYKASPIPNAYGPHVADPRSGEIICSHVGLFHNVLSLAQAWYFAQCSPNDPRVRQFPFDDAMMGKLMEYIVTHEIGHTLGLRHNFAGSWTFKIDEIRNRDFVKKYSHGSTVMDYMRFNYVAQPEDKIDPEDLIPKISFYDDFAIAWGYQYLPQFTTPKEEEDYLKNWVTEQRKANPRVHFGTETDREDPRYQAEDLGENSMKAGELGMNNLKVVMKNVEAWTAGDDDDYSVLNDMYASTRSQYWRYIHHAMKNIGGRYSDWSLRSEQMQGYVPVPKATQQDAMKFLKKYFFTDQTWLLDGRCAQLTRFDGVGYKQRAAMQVYAYLFNKAPNLLKHEELIDSEAYTLKNMTDDLYGAVWGNLSTKKSLSIFERGLQTEYVKVACEMLKKAPNEKIPEFTMLMVAQLEQISKQAKQSAKMAGDVLTKNHLLGISGVIDAWVTGDQKALLK